MADPRDYATIKADFEKARFFVRDGAVCAVDDDDGAIKQYPRRVFVDMYNDMGTVRKDGALGGTTSFVRRWLKDAAKRAYDEVQFAPPPVELRPGACNSFRGFAAARIQVPASGNLQPFVDYVGLQCQGDEARRTYLLKWLAHLIQRPGDRSNRVMPLVYGPHGVGTGKSHLVEQFGRKVLGRRLFAQTCSTDVLVAASSGKLLVLYDDMTGMDVPRKLEAKRKRIDGFARLWATTYRTPFGSARAQLVSTYSDHAIAVERDRRVFATAASVERAGDIAYHAAFADYMEDPANVRTVYDYLLGLPLDGWHAEWSMPGR